MHITKTNSARLIYTLLPLITGCVLYIFFRQQPPFFLSGLNIQPTDISFPGIDWLPDYLWCISLLSLISFIWKGWNNIPFYWLCTIWIFTVSTEVLQFKQMIPGTFDMKDILAYQAAFATYILMNRKTNPNEPSR